jgi:hypothetical protein
MLYILAAVFIFAAVIFDDKPATVRGALAYWFFGMACIHIYCALNNIVIY